MPCAQHEIERHALIGDCHSAALVAADGTIDWCCFHRFDQRPSFAGLVDHLRGGWLAVTPGAPARFTQRYRPSSNVLETRFETSSGAAVIVDAMSLGSFGPEMPPMELVRLVSCERGSVTVDVEIAPRFDYGMTVPRVRAFGSGIFAAYGGADAVEIETDAPLRIDPDGSALLGRLRLAEGEQCFVRVRSVDPHMLAPQRRGRADVAARIQRADDFWSSWASRCTYDGPYREAVVRSALVLKALTNAPTGAIVAAPTTSLPETLGGVRNWDYRYTWLRDAAMHLDALFALGYVDEARAFVAWLARTTAGRADELQVVYGSGGERLLPEIDLPLAGHAGARPVRIGNAAASQRQLDVYGHVVSTVHRWLEHGGELDDDLWLLVRGIVEIIERRYLEPDQGIWEVRGQPQHFVASKVLAWVAVDRALAIAERTGRDAPLDRWRMLRDAIRNVVLTRGWSHEKGSFVRAFGDDVVDASLLEIALYGFLPADDPRFSSTLARIDTELAEGPFLRRYRTDDGLPGEEGAFVIASFWRVIALAAAGRRREAREAFEAILRRANHVGLFAEEIDPATGVHLGNFPQSFSHVGLVSAAVAIGTLERA